jgi:serine/threonine-protein kinase RsbT
MTGRGLKTAMPRKSETLPIWSASDIVAARQTVRQWAIDMKFTLVDQTKIVTAASELARNTLQHGGGGTMQIETVENGPYVGLRLTFVDKGPGIPDIQAAMKDGYTTGGGMGLGLSGSKRLMSQFEIETKVGEGTRVVVTRWK